MPHASAVTSSTVRTLALALTVLGCGAQTKDDCILKYVSEAGSDERADLLLDACEAKFPEEQEHGEAVPESALSQLDVRVWGSPRGEEIRAEVYNGTSFTLISMQIRVTSKGSDLSRVYRLTPRYSVAPPLSNEVWSVRAVLPTLPRMQSVAATAEPPPRGQHYDPQSPISADNLPPFELPELPRFAYKFELVGAERQR